MNADGHEKKEKKEIPYSYDCSRMRSAEEVVGGVIDDVLTEGGHMLWQKYLQRKAFPFAAENATDVLVSQLRMCFVAHDAGECDDLADLEDWSLEQEPIPAEVDNWARMQLTVRRKQKKHNNDLSPDLRRPDRRLQTMRTRASDARKLAKNRDTKKTEESRSMDLKEDIQVDDEEEKLREARLQQDNRKRDLENKVRLNEKAKELEQQRVQALHEEMSRRQHTFDSDGGLIWVEDLKLDRLPKVQEIFPYFVKRDPRAAGALNDTTAGKGKDSPVNKKAQGRSKRRFDRNSKTKMDEDDFPDSFSKLQHGQPPILETMVVKPGVVLDVYGKSKAGPPVAASGVGMSRKEYVTLTEKEVAHEATFNSMSDPSGEQKEPSSPYPGGPPGTAGSRGATAEGDGAVDGSLPPIAGGTGGSNAGRAASRGGGSRGGTGAAAKAGEEKKEKAEVQMAPAAPSMSVRSRGKMTAIGHLGQPPRLHVAPLGGPYGFGVAQPPLGATMGHGLHRHGSAKDSYFFPHQVPEMPSLLKATSEMSIGPKGRGIYSSPRTPGRYSPTGASREASRQMERSQTAPGKSLDMDEEYSPRHGVMRVEKKSTAYRGMRQTLFPNTLASGYVAGM